LGRFRKGRLGRIKGEIDVQNQGLKARVERLLNGPKRPSKKTVLNFTLFALISILMILVGIGVGYYLGTSDGQTGVWNQIRANENWLRDLYSNSTQAELKAWLPGTQMNFTDGLVWESQRLNYTEDRPQYQNVIQVLRNEKGACGEFVWMFCAFCVAKNIPFRMVTVGYFVPNVVDHTWVQVNPSHDGQTWIHVEVTDSCARIAKGSTVDQLWNITINNNSYYTKSHYKMVLAYQLNEDGEVVITDVTSTFSQP
jgi:hypothetical protein